MRTPRTLLAATTMTAAALTLVACGDSGSSAASSSASPTFSSVPTAELKVQATGEACQASSSALTAGKVTVVATSSANGEAEVYLYGSENGQYTKIVGEVEGLSTGLTKSFTADVPPGSYEISCKSDGKDLRVPVTAK